MKKVLLISLVIFNSILCAGHVTEYFPENIFSDDKELDSFIATWYTGQLKALKEPSLLIASQKGKRQIYRFLWLRTFHNPISIRIEILNSKAKIIIKKTDGAGGYDPGNLELEKTKEIDKKEIRELLELIKESKFWNTDTKDPTESGCDGAQWIIEGVKNNKYHIVDRWSPEEGNIYTLGLYFLKLSRLEIKNIY
jgi:hypothetical protein